MRKLSFYPKLAARSMKSNRRFYVPYILTVIGTAAAFYIMAAIVSDPGSKELAAGTANGQVYVSMFMTLGMFVLGLFSFIFLLYTNSFLMKRRQKELGLYSVLGMSKTNIAGIMVFESLYIAVIGIAGGLAVGILLTKLVSLALFKLMRLPVPFGFTVQPIAIIIVVLFFAALIFLTLLANLAKVGRSRPVELLRGGNVGEKEPKASWFLTLVGIIFLGAGYVVAMLVDNPGMAVAVYFLAVFAVIIGTYCLFTSISIAVLKALRRNRRYYYKAKHFISVSGMLYRMKRNAVGLANICILCTMVMVMISGTLSLYLGSAEQVNAYCPADVVVEATYYSSSNEDHVYNDETGEETIENHTPFDAAAMDAWFGDYFAAHKLTPSSAKSVEYYSFTAVDAAEHVSLVTAVTAETYAQLTGEPAPELAAGQALAHVPAGYELGDSLSFMDKDGGTVSIELVGEAKLTAAQIALNMVAVNWSEEDKDIVLVVPDRAALLELVAGQENGSYIWRGQYDFDASDEAVSAMVDDYWAASRESGGLLRLARHRPALRGGAGGLRPLGRLPVPGRVPRRGVHDGDGADHLLQAGVRGLRGQRPLRHHAQGGPLGARGAPRDTQPDTDGVLHAHTGGGGAHSLRLQSGGAAAQAVLADEPEAHGAVHAGHAAGVLRGVRGGVRPDRAVVLQDSPSEQREREIGGAGIWTLQSC